MNGFLIPEIDAQSLKRARAKARAARKERWWLEKRNSGRCYYCKGVFSPKDLTMDHIVPLARGGATTPGNVVAACLPCNRSKDAATPVDLILSQLGDGT
jgi:5-methylcytosine-specific restriction protein A